MAWRQIERTFLFLGFLGALAAFATGDTARRLVMPDRALVRAHSFFAGLSIWLYGILLLGEIVAIVNAKYFSKNTSLPAAKYSSFLEKILCNRVYSGTLAFCALIALFLTGLLGGAMIYGVSADPLAPFVLKLLGITLS